ncbi:MAG: hypothetical protein GY853_03310 [PVC group bacterium]|nr:hypothetical protein [PVC group bacterium]
MPIYNSRQKIKSGMTLGGIGAGKLEITPYGTIDYLTLQNNWTNPLKNQTNQEKAKAQGVAGFHFALHVNTQAAVVCKLLQTEKIQDYNTIKHIDFNAKFPFANLTYKDDNLPVEISLCAYSFLIPGDVKHSSLPAVVFEFQIKNKIHKEIEVGLLSIGRNIISCNSVGRFNALRKEGKLIGIEFSHEKPLAHDTTAGDMFMAVPKKSGEISFWSQWNMQREKFCFEPNVGLDAFEYFEKEGCLPNITSHKPTESQSVELGAALAVNSTLKPHEQKKIPFILTWNFPRHFQGHFYERGFNKSRDTAVYISKNLDNLKGSTTQLPMILNEMETPDWLNDALMNNLYPLFSSTWFTRKSDFTMYEAPLCCPLMGTLDVYFYASVAVGFLFPGLDKRALMLFKKNMRKSGYVPHDIGYERIDLPSNGTTTPLWKDLNSKLILLVYKAYLGSGDLKFLKEMYPALKRAFVFSLTYDKNGDGLPDNEGFDTTFDTWGFTGASSYNGGVFLVGLLALKRIAEILNDKKTALKCVQSFMRGRKTMEETLWNGKYYITALSDNKKYDSCMVAQLFGQWYAYLLGLGRMFPEENIKNSISWIFKLNNNDSPFGATNSVFLNRKRDEQYYHSRNIWPGVCYSFAALAIHEGFVKEGLKLTKKVWDTLSVKNKNPWNQPDVIIAKDGSFGFGDYYMRNMVIWAVLLALAEKDKKVRRGLEKIKELVNSHITP